MPEVTKSVRYRVQVSTTSKGLKSYEAVVDIGGATMEEVLKESDALVRELDKRYPPNLGG